MSSDTPLRENLKVHFAAAMQVGELCADTDIAYVVDLAFDVANIEIKTLKLQLTRAHEDKRALREAIQKLIVDCDFIGEERVSGRSVAKDLRKVLSATASPEPAKNTEGAK